jgi:hypothetical protein
MGYRFVGYGRDCLVVATAGGTAARLSDRLRSTAPLDLESVVAQRFEDGGRSEAVRVAVYGSDLLAVEALDAMSDRSRRVPTVCQTVLLEMGPYLVQGDLHGRRGAPALVSLHHCGGWAALSGATVRLHVAGQVVDRPVATLLVNTAMIDAATPIDDRFPMPMLIDAAGEDDRHPLQDFTYG